MKRTTFFATLAIAAAALLSACGGSDNSVKVNMSSVDTEYIYLGFCGINGDILSREDTVAVKDGVATLDLSRHADSTPIAYFFVTDQGEQVYFVPQSSALSFNVKENEPGNPDAGYTFEYSSSKLSEDNQKLQELYTLRSKYTQISTSLNEEFKAAAISNDSIAADDIRERFGKMMDDMTKEINDFIAANITNAAGKVALVNNLDQFKFDVAAFDALISGLPEGDFKTKVSAKMDPMRKIQPGAPYIDVALPTPEGDTLTLSSIVEKNKVTLLDFWASWCGPCRQFNPILVEIYKEFHPKGFEIYGVSLDQEKDKWTAAIKDQNLTWFHVSNLKKWDCPARKDYHIDGIPASVLIGQDGKIIAHSLDGDELKAKLNELLAE